MDVLSSSYKGRLLIPVLVILVIVGVGVFLLATGSLPTRSDAISKHGSIDANGTRYYDAVVVGIRGDITDIAYDYRDGVIRGVTASGFKVGDEVRLEVWADGTLHLYPR